MFVRILYTSGYTHSSTLRRRVKNKKTGECSPDGGTIEDRLAHLRGEEKKKPLIPGLDHFKLVEAAGIE
jgi:hypothetical protein